MGCGLNAEWLRTEPSPSLQHPCLPASTRMGCGLNVERLRTEPSPSLQHPCFPASACMGCSLNVERLRTELCSNCKATLTGQEEDK